MNSKNNLFLILILFFIHESSFSQNVQMTETSTLYNIDFDHLNSINLEQIEVQAQYYFMKEDFEKAAKFYLKIIHNNIDDANAYYRLACCYARLDKPAYAGNFLIMAVNAGFNDFLKIKNEESFKYLKANQLFESTLKDVLDYGKRYGQTAYIEAKSLLKTRFFLPENFDANKSYHLLLALHGYGGTAETFSSIYSTIESDNYIVVFPEAPYLKSGGGSRILQYSWDFEVRSEELWKKSDPSVIEYIMNVADYFNESFKIDKTYILGFSQGAGYAYATGIKNASMIDAVIAFGGRLPDTKKYPWFISESDLIAGKELNICIVHGENDIAVDYKQSIQTKKLLSKLNYNVHMISLDGGHFVEKESLNNALKWIEEQK